jgi:hypothetical protein
MNSTMPGEEVRVTSMVSGRVERAVKLKCVGCGHDTFVALLIGDARDLHLQCAECGESHCSHGSQCHEEEK